MPAEIVACGGLSTAGGASSEAAVNGTDAASERNRGGTAQLRGKEGPTTQSAKVKGCSDRPWALFARIFRGKVSGLKWPVGLLDLLDIDGTGRKCAPSTIGPVE